MQHNKDTYLRPYSVNFIIEAKLSSEKDFPLIWHMYKLEFLILSSFALVLVILVNFVNPNMVHNMKMISF